MQAVFELMWPKYSCQMGNNCLALANCFNPKWMHVFFLTFQGQGDSRSLLGATQLPLTYDPGFLDVMSHLPLVCSGFNSASALITRDVINSKDPHVCVYACVWACARVCACVRVRALATYRDEKSVLLNKPNFSSPEVKITIFTPYPQRGQLRRLSCVRPRKQHAQKMW